MLNHLNSNTFPSYQLRITIHYFLIKCKCVSVPLTNHYPNSPWTNCTWCSSSSFKYHVWYPFNKSHHWRAGLSRSSFSRMDLLVDCLLVRGSERCSILLKFRAALKQANEKLHEEFTSQPVNTIYPFLSSGTSWFECTYVSIRNDIAFLTNLRHLAYYYCGIPPKWEFISEQRFTLHISALQCDFLTDHECRL